MDDEKNVAYVRTSQGSYTYSTDIFLNIFYFDSKDLETSRNVKNFNLTNRTYYIDFKFVK